MATCLHCGTQFQHAPRRGRKAKYCSAKCRRSRNAARSKPRTNKLPRREKLRRRRERLRRKIERCPTCGIEFVNAAGRQKFCTHDCAMAAQRIHPPEEYGERECRQCGKVFNKARNCRGDFCCKPCYFAWTAANGTMIAAHLEVYANRERRAVSDGYVWWLGRWKNCGACGTLWWPGNTQVTHCPRCRPWRGAMASERGRLLGWSTTDGRVRPISECKSCGSRFIKEKRRSWDRCPSCIERRAAEYRRQWSRKRKALERAASRRCRAHSFDPDDVFRRDHWICQHCGCKTRPDYHYNHGKYPNLDHIIPLSRGGEHSVSNTQCLCRTCNMAKGANVGGDQLVLGYKCK